MRDELPVEQRAHYPVTNIYKLREAMINEDSQFDLREVYLAVHHIMKYRGHFLNNASVDKFKVGRIDFYKSFNVLTKPTRSFKTVKVHSRLSLARLKKLDNCC